MNKEAEIKNYLNSLKYSRENRSFIAVDPKSSTTWTITVSIEDAGDLTEATLMNLLKDEVIRSRFPGYWTSLFVHGKSTFGLF